MKLAMTDMDRLSRTTSDTSEIRLRLFALGFVGLLCAMTIGFIFALRLLVPNSVDYGYDERVGTGSLSASRAGRMSDCLGDNAAIAGASRDGLDRVGVSAIAAHAAGVAD